MKNPNASYYDAGGISTMDVLKAKLTPEQLKGFLLGNIITYALRANFKGQFDSDVDKIGPYQDELKSLKEPSSEEIDKMITMSQKNYRKR